MLLILDEILMPLFVARVKLLSIEVVMVEDKNDI